MRVAELTRADFLDWLGVLGRGGDPGAQPMGARAGQSDVQLIWTAGDPGGDPLIAVDASEMREFLAFTSTYVGTHSPFTAFFRVVPRQLLDHLPRGREALRPEVMQAFIGAIIADATLQIGGPTPRLSDIALQAGLATPSAVVVSATALGYDNDLALAALDRWHHIRMELRGGTTRVPIQRLKSFWGSALSALAVEGGDVAEQNDATPRVLLDAASRRNAGGSGALATVPELEGLARSLQGSREERVRVLDQVWMTLQRSGSPPERCELVLGYVAAQVGEGSLNYLSLANRFADEYPLALLWFGLFSGLKRETDIMTAGECFGRRLLRRLQGSRGPELPPIQADLSYEEFLLLSQEGRIPKLRVEQQSVIEVELLPGVCGRFRSVRGQRRDDESGRSNATIEQARRLVAQLQTVLREADAPPRPSMGSLFEPQNSEKSSTNRPRNPQRRKTK